MNLKKTKIENIVRRLRRRKGPVIPPPSSVEFAYRRLLLGLVGEWRKLYKNVIGQNLESLVQEASLVSTGTTEPARRDSWADNLETLMNQLEVGMERTVSDVQASVLDIGQRSSQWHDKKWQGTMSDIVGVPLFRTEPWLVDQLKAFSHQNVTLIKNLQQDTYKEIDRTITSGILEGRRHESISRDILSNTDLEPGTFRKARTRANLIARDQVGALNSQLDRHRQTDAGIEHYIWRDVGDVRVRESHTAMDGKFCRWDDPTAYKNAPEDKVWKQRASIGGVEKHPGEDIQCRCAAEAYLVDLIGGV